MFLSSKKGFVSVYVELCKIAIFIPKIANFYLLLVVPPPPPHTLSVSKMGAIFGTKVAFLQSSTYKATKPFWELKNIPKGVQMSYKQLGKSVANFEKKRFLLIFSIFSLIYASTLWGGCTTQIKKNEVIFEEKIAILQSSTYMATKPFSTRFKVDFGVPKL